MKMAPAGDLKSRNPAQRAKAFQCTPTAQDEKANPAGQLRRGAVDAAALVGIFLKRHIAGPLLHRLVPKRVRRRRKLEERERTAARAKAEERAIIEPAFDSDYYRWRYPDVADARIDPVLHYIEHGARAARDPSPEFSTKYYVQRYPDVAKTGLNPYYHYLTIGRPEGRAGTAFSAGDPNFDTMCQILGQPPEAIAEELVRRRHHLRQRLETGVLREMVNRAGQLEPLIHQSSPAAMAPRILPFHGEQAMARISAIRDLQSAAQGRRARSVIVLGSHGIARVERAARHLLNALGEIYGEVEVVVLVTNERNAQLPNWVPQRYRWIDFSSLSRGLPIGEQQTLLVQFIRSLCPSAVFNLNSSLLWDAMLPFGKALSKRTALFAYLFCNEAHDSKHSDLYADRYFYRYFDLLSAVITDDKLLESDLRTRFQIPANISEKLVTLHAPIDVHIPLVQARQPSISRRPRIYWCGCFDRRSHMDIVAAVAGRLPEVDFHLWRVPASHNDIRKPTLPDNVFAEVAYQGLSDLPLEDCDLWLHTSQWDGAPNLLIEVASTGLPLVGRLAAGYEEVLLEGLCERVTEVDDIDAFVAAIQRVLGDPDAARRKAALLRDRMLAERSPEQYRLAIEKLLLCGVPAQEPSTPSCHYKTVTQGSEPKDEFDLTLVLIAHSETILAGPTIRSAELTIAAAEAAGYRVERLLCLDAATAQCRSFFMQPAFVPWRKLELDARDLGLARNMAAHAAQGRWIAWLDADDLLSENWLAAAAQLLGAAEEEGDKVIVHTEMNCIFDGDSSVFVKPMYDDPIFMPHYYYFANYHDSLSVAPRAAHTDVPYVHRDIPNGLSYQDWQWNIETTAAGYRHVIARDTITFQRRKDDSLSLENRQRRSTIRSLESMSIDKIAQLGKVAGGDELGVDSSGRYALSPRDAR